jgi:hypothetical protein
MTVSIDVDLRDRLNAARDQGQRPTCVVFAVSAAHEFRRGPEYLSPEYLFFSGAQRTHKDPRQGLTRNAVRDALMLDGQPPEATWPYSAVHPTASAWKPPSSAATHKAGIDFVIRSVAEVRTLIQGGTPVLLIAMATAAMYTPDDHGIVRGHPRDKPTSRHALLAVGSGRSSDGEYLLVRNSWGQDWGLAGHAWLHDPYLTTHLEITGTIET